jgi:transcriptional regulator with XRE-family HTH domain
VPSIVSPAHAVFGQTVRTNRTDRGWSQQGLADRAGLHRNYVGAVELGRRNVSLRNMLALARALDMPLAELVREVDADS